MQLEMVLNMYRVSDAGWLVGWVLLGKGRDFTD